MGIAFGFIVTTVGSILALAVHPSHPGSVNVNTVGWILVVVGLISLLADLLLWSSWGPGFLRRRTVVRDGYGAQPPSWGYPRRRVVEEEEVPGPGPGPGY